MSTEESAYPGFDLSELLQLEAELCTPLKRGQWITKGPEPHKVRAGMLNEVLDRCKEKGLKMNDLAPVLAYKGFYARKKERERQNKIYELFSENRTQAEGDPVCWQSSQEILTAMLRGLENGVPGPNEREQVVGRIVSFFFPVDLTSNAGRKAELPPPFFRRERVRSHFVACPHDNGEANFYAASLGRIHFESSTKVRWFMASGGDHHHSVRGPAFGLWAERMAAALCFGVDFTFAIPQMDKGKTPIEDFLERFDNYWNNELDLAKLRIRYPELARKIVTKVDVAELARQHMKVVPIPMSGEGRTLDSAALKKMFPYAPFFRALSDMKDQPQLYGATFLNPWLRFHWADLLDTSQARCDPQYAAITYSDSPQRSTSHLVPPESMFEYAKWLSVFTQPTA